MSEQTKSAHAALLNALAEMQESPAYAVRKGVLAEAERVILRLEALAAFADVMKGILSDPNAVRMNLMRGTIARPDDLIFRNDEHGPYMILQRELAAAQARIDELMMEYCPGEMTPEQIAEWAKHQRPAPADAKPENVLRVKKW